MAQNYATIEMGAEIVDVSSAPFHISSTPANLLLDRDDLMWMTGEAPQHVTIRIAPDHPPIKFVGWHVWRDYVSNPKTVQIFAGSTLDGLNLVMECTALPGAGSQVWELSAPIAMSDTYVKFRIVNTFGTGPTYMNRLILFATHPGPGFHAKHQSSTEESAKTSENVLRSTTYSTSSAAVYNNNASFSSSSNANESTESSSNNLTRKPSRQMTELLKGLDEDIKMLHPIRTISPPRLIPTGLQTSIDPFIAEDPFAGPPTPPAPAQAPPPPPPPPQIIQLQAPPPPPVPAEIMFRINSLERVVESLNRATESQGNDIREIRRLLLEQQIATNNNLIISRSSSSAATGDGERGRGTNRAQGTRRRGNYDEEGEEEEDEDRGGSRRKARKAISNHAHTSSSSFHACSPHSHLIEFPERALKHYIEDVLAPRLAKHAKRAEAKTLSLLEDHLRAIMKQIGDTVDNKVEKYLYQLAMDGTRHPHSSHGSLTNGPGEIDANKDIASRSTVADHSSHRHRHCSAHTRQKLPHATAPRVTGATRR